MMKTIKKMILVAIMLVSVLSYAEKAVNVNGKVAVVEFEHVKKGQKLIVKDANDSKIYSEKISKSGFYSKSLNFQSFKEGIYTIELERDFEITIIPFEITKNTIVIEDNKSHKLFKPLVISEGNTLKVSQLTLETNSLDVEIYYENELIYSEIIENETSLKRVFKLDYRAKGNYSILVKTNNRTFEEDFRI